VTQSSVRNKRIPWEQRLEAARERWPSCRPDFDWKSALQDDDLLGRILRDVLRVGYEAPTRRGQRSPLEPEVGMPRLKELRAQHDLASRPFTVKPFVAAFRELIAGRYSRTQLARKTGISRTQIQRLLTGELEPTPPEMELVAAAFGKEPTYFLEFRVALASEYVARRLMTDPELSMRVVRHLQAAG
jgi:transcriptional regulator with XRE-family HTH domain